MVTFLSLSTLTLIVQPYKKSYINVLDGLILALLGFLTLLIVTFLYILPSENKVLPLIIMIACALPQLVLLLSVTYRQLKGRRIVQYIAGRASRFVKANSQNKLKASRR